MLHIGAILVQCSRNLHKGYQILGGSMSDHPMGQTLSLSKTDQRSMSDHPMGQTLSLSKTDQRSVSVTQWAKPYSFQKLISILPRISLVVENIFFLEHKNRPSRSLNSRRYDARPLLTLDASKYSLMVHIIWHQSSYLNTDSTTNLLQFMEEGSKIIKIDRKICKMVLQKGGPF